MQDLTKVILVTGGCGFLGHNLCPRLVSENYHVICLDRCKADFIDEYGIEFIQADLSEGNIVEKLPKGLDAIVHLASTVVPETSNLNVLGDVQQNVENAIRLLDFCAKEHVSKFVFMSSGGTVYGDEVLQVPIPEKHQTEPICSYGISKLAIEKYMALYHRLHGIQTCAVRLANPYGRFQNPKAKQGVIPIFCRKALEGSEIQIYGDGKVERDFIYVNDVCDAMVKILQADKQLGVMNIGNGVGVTINDIICNLSKLLNRKLNVQYFPGRSFDVKSNVLDISKAKQELSWQPKTDFMTGLQYTLDYMIPLAKKA